MGNAGSKRAWAHEFKKPLLLSSLLLLPRQHHTNANKNAKLSKRVELSIIYL